MLEYLHIKNVALIDEQFINFGEGLNILTGETGAGKSMIIDSINFVLGERVSRDFIRKGAENAFVEVLFFIKNIKTINMIESLNIEVDENNSLLISRELNKNGRTIFKINGKGATMNIIKEISSILIDIHGQHQHQSLLNDSKHIILLDQFCGNELQSLKDELHLEYQEYKNIQNDIKQLSGNEMERQQKIDIYRYQVDEIEAAKLKLGEEKELSNKKKLLSGAEKLISGIEEIGILLNGDDNYIQGAVSQINRINDLLKELSNIDISLSDLINQAENIELQIEDLSLNIRNYSRNIDHNPDELYEIETRLDLIYNLKKKYGSNIEEILKYYDKIKNQLDFIINSEAELKKLNQKLNLHRTKIIELCQKMSEIRKIKALQIEKQIEETLTELEMKSARFKIKLDQKEEFSENGFDKVEFLISANAGENLKPLAKIASGGEMSRVMLALKTVLADIDNIESLIFDEIDAGISGRTAQKVAEKMSFVSKNHQILCITHLPQIAAMADSHYLIEKLEQNNKTVTCIYDLNESESVSEIARLIGGALITQTTIIAAQEMKKLAKDFN